MTKNKVLYLLREFEDAVVDIKGSTSIVCTTNFKTKYIKQIRRTEKFSLKDNVLVFSWTDNKFAALPVRSIIKVAPLSSLLRNVS